MPSRSSDPFGDALDAAAARVAEAIGRVGATNPVILIDGRAGAGKSSLAERLVRRWPIAGRVQLVALDAIYPGWDGLDEGAERATEWILQPHARGLIGTWQRWDWERETEAESSAVDPGLGLIVEGCGVLTPRSARLTDVAVWVDGPADTRRHRALARDGDGFRPHWDRWARQEDEHIRRDGPADLASIVIEVP